MKHVLSCISLILLSSLLTCCSSSASVTLPSETPSAGTPAVSATPETTATLIPSTPVPTVEATVEPTPEETQEPDEEIAADYWTDQWVAVEIPFQTTKTYNAREQLYVYMDVEFTNFESGKTLVIPAFWYEGNTFMVRFAPTETGYWSYTAKCSTDASLNGQSGMVLVNPYSGNLAIYQHGFVTVNGSKHFVYADGTPFFYLGDTHWTMMTEEFDKPGKYAGSTGASSHFKYIVDKRAEQGFTVYQSEPIGFSAALADGSLSAADAKQFKKLDQYFQYIAQKGLVHANAQFFFASNMTKKLAQNTAYLEALSRYWVARYSAYPVMWTLAQEIDNDFYYESKKHVVYDYTNNPWVLIAEYMHKYDAYQNPLSGHQETTRTTTVTGAGTTKSVGDNGRSSFYSDEVTKKTGHNWWAAQWKPSSGLSISSQLNDTIPKDYWNSPKVSVNYEGAYEYLATKNFGGRAQAWISYLSGFFGYGYGVQDIWYYRTTYNADSTTNDGVDKVTPEDKAAMTWSQAVNLPTAYQLGYMRSFFESFDWWNLVPDFNDQKAFKPVNDKDVFYVCAHKGSDVVVVYFYSFTKATGTVVGLNGRYEAKWFNPRTNTYTKIGDIQINGSWTVPNRSEALDFVLLLKKK